MRPAFCVVPRRALRALSFCNAILDHIRYLHTIAGMLTVFALGNDRIPHTFFAFMLFMDIVFLVIESRRWSLFAFSRNRDGVAA